MSHTTSAELWRRTAWDQKLNCRLTGIKYGFILRGMDLSSEPLCAPCGLEREP